jgi:hypothetical protein
VRPRLLVLSGLVPLALLTAGCGARSSAPYTATGSAKCLTAKGYTGVTTAPAKVGFIAGFAENGGIRAKSPSGNVVTIAFAADATDAAQTATAFAAHATPFYRRHIHDVLQIQRNAVMVWTTAPTRTQIATVTGCLGS